MDNKTLKLKRKSTPWYSKLLIFSWLFVLCYLILSETIIFNELSNYNGLVTFGAMGVCFVIELLGGYQYSKREVVFIFIILMSFLQSALLEHISIVSEILFFLFILRKVDRIQLVRITIYTIIIAVFSVVVLSALRIIPSEIFLVSNRIRFSFGFTYPSKVQTYLMLIIFLWINSGFKGHIHIIGLLFLDIISTFVFLFTDTNYPFYIGIMASIFSIIIKVSPYKIINIELPVFIYSVTAPILPALLSISYSLNDSLIFKLDELLSGRLYYSYIAMMYRSLCFFNYNPMISTDDFTKNIYGFFDSGYLYIMYNYGLYLYGIMIVVLLIAVRNAIKVRDSQMLITFVFTIFYSMWYGHVITYLQYSIPVILCTYYFPWKSNNEL